MAAVIFFHNKVCDAGHFYCPRRRLIANRHPLGELPHFQCFGPLSGRPELSIEPGSCGGGMFLNVCALATAFTSQSPRAPDLLPVPNLPSVLPIAIRITL